jgi:hypothetical protein
MIKYTVASRVHQNQKVLIFTSQVPHSHQLEKKKNQKATANKSKNWTQARKNVTKNTSSHTKVTTNGRVAILDSGPG